MSVRFVRQSGFTLIELLLVLTLSAIGLVGLTQWFGDGTAQADVLETVRNISDLRQRVSAYGRLTQNGFTGLNNTVVLQNNLAPPALMRNGTTLGTSAGAITVRAAPQPGLTQPFAEIDFAVDRRICTQVIAALANTVTTLNVQTTGRSAVAVNANGYLPVNAINGCSGGDPARIQVVFP